MSEFPARRILTPMDLTPLSKRAWEWARLFAGPKTSFEALFVYDLPTAPLLGVPYVPMPPSAEKKAAEWLREACPGAAILILEGDPVSAIERRAKRADLLVMATREAVKPRVILRAGDPVREILLESARHGLVVLTAHRKSLLQDLALGTTAERVLRFSRTAVLTAPSGR